MAEIKKSCSNCCNLSFTPTSVKCEYGWGKPEEILFCGQWEPNMENELMQRRQENATLRQQLQQAQATIAAMRGQQALSDRAGMELLEKIEQLERENKALRCCANCKEIVWKCKKIIECTDNYRGWVIAERLVSKGDR